MRKRRIQGFIAAPPGTDDTPNRVDLKQLRFKLESQKGTVFFRFRLVRIEPSPDGQTA